jgi:hypothetical protein
MATARGYGAPAKAESRYGDGASEATKDPLPLVDRLRKQLAGLSRTRRLEAVRADPSLPPSLKLRRTGRS